MKKIYIFSCLLALIASSCSDFLDVRPKGEKVENDLFDTPSGFEDAINGVYGAMAMNSLYGMDLVWGIPEILGQNLNCGSDVGVDLARYNYSGNQYVRDRLSAVWTDAYKAIGYANNVLQNLEKQSPDNLPLYNYYKGEMLGVRAMLHFDLLRLFAPTDKSKQGIPYVTSYSFSVKPFSTVGEVYTKLIADLTEAESLLADDEKVMKYPRDNSQYDKFLNWRETHINLYAVRALLARVCWMSGDNANAAKYAESVISSGRFPLVEPDKVPTCIAGVLSPEETIFGLYSNSYLDVSQKYLYTYSSYFSYNPYDNITGATRLEPWTALYSLDVDATTQDFRRNQFRQSGGVAMSLKLVDCETIEQTVSSSRNLISGISLINTSEMYLIAADALFATNPEKALGYFNDEIKSRGLTALQSIADLNTEKIYNEFHKELYGLGQHWYNLKRLNRDIVSNHESRVIPASETVYVLPIPQEEFEYRPK